jgi:two-component system sensor histidine kinase/response regulator
MKLLLVEDNIENAKLVIRILQTAGYEVMHKVSGLEGMSMIRKETFDGILLDFDLPDIDGSQVGLALRKRLPNMPIIALTAHADRTSRMKAKSFGFTAFIPKPFTDDDLLSVIQTVVNPGVTDVQS